MSKELERAILTPAMLRQTLCEAMCGFTHVHLYLVLADQIIEALASKGLHIAPVSERLMPEPRETQQSIWKWCEQTFGPSTAHARMVERTQEEMTELAEAVKQGSPKAPEEIADVIICLMRLAGDMGADVQAEIDRKMAINRARKWTLKGDGTAYHVKEGEPVSEQSIPSPAETALRQMNELVEQLQSAVTDWLTPDTYRARFPTGPTYDFHMPYQNNSDEAKAKINRRRDDAFINDIIHLLDGPEQREAQSAARAVLEQIIPAPKNGGPD